MPKLATNNAHTRYAEVIELRARVGKLEAEIRWMKPKPGESYTAWVERLFHVMAKDAA